MAYPTSRASLRIGSISGHGGLQSSCCDVFSIGNVTIAATRRLRVGVLPHSLRHRVADNEVQAGVDATCRLLEALGHSLRPTEWPVDGFALAEDFGALYTNGALSVVKLFRANTGQDPDETHLEPANRA